MSENPWRRLPIDWKKRYDELAELTQGFLEKLKEAEFLKSRIESHFSESRRLDLDYRNVCRLMRLTQDVVITTEFMGGRHLETKYPAGTLIECDKTGYVYLDDDGDGELHFPPQLLEPVELDRDAVDWDKVICQG